jgi:hypothetical protein
MATTPATRPIMKDVRELRRENLRKLIADNGGVLALGLKLGYADGSFLSQVAGPNPRRVVSEGIARSIEAKLGMPTGWLDAHHVDTAFREEMMLECMTAVTEAIQAAGKKVNPQVMREIVGLAFDQAKISGHIDRDFIRKLTSLIA